MQKFQDLFLSETIKIPNNVKIEFKTILPENSNSVLSTKNDLSPQFALQTQLYMQVLEISGPLGTIKINVSKIDSQGVLFFKKSKEEKELEIFVISTKKYKSEAKAKLGSIVALINNSFHGVCQGFVIYLELVGVGFRALLQEKSAEQQQGISSTTSRGNHEEKSSKNNQIIEFKIGQTHDIFFPIPNNIRAFSLKPNLFCLYGIEKTQINQLASSIRNLKFPEPYKGKGIRFKDEKISLKTGKKK